MSNSATDELIEHYTTGIINIGDVLVWLLHRAATIPCDELLRGLDRTYIDRLRSFVDELPTSDEEWRDFVHPASRLFIGGDGAREAAEEERALARAGAEALRGHFGIERPSS